MFTIMLWRSKGELRVVSLAPILDPDSPWWPYDATRYREMRFLPEHQLKPPQFATADEAWQFISDNYPQLHP